MSQLLLSKVHSEALVKRTFLTLLILLLSTTHIAWALSDSKPIQLKPGDTVAIITTVPGKTPGSDSENAPNQYGRYGGEFVLQADGAIYGQAFGRLVLQGKTWEQAQVAVRKAMKGYVKETEVFLIIKSQSTDYVYVVTGNETGGPIEIKGEMRLSQVLAAADLTESPDLVQATVFRQDKTFGPTNVGQLLRGEDPTANIKLEPQDTITVVPISRIWIWVTGLVESPGRIAVPEGTDLYEAVAAAGGLKTTNQRILPIDAEARIVVRRGTTLREFPTKRSPLSQDLTVQAGDTIEVVGPDLKSVTIAGFVKTPGEYILQSGSSALGAIAKAGGPNPEGNLSRITVFRKGEVYQIDARPTVEAPFMIETGDLIYVNENVDAFYVLGNVTRPGRILMTPGRTYTLQDALAAVNGLDRDGTLRRIYVARADGQNGKVTVKQYNLDEYLKDGKLASNPEIMPGDAILFGRPKSNILAALPQILSSLILFDQLTRN